jgi:fructose-1,6-bisphosphatase/inositol monophosphatase family enzyme
VPLVVHVEAVVDRVALQVCHETGDVDDCHDSAGYRACPMKPDRLALLHEVVDAVGHAFARVTDLGPSGRREGQYALDIAANDAALPLIRAAGLGVLSEESEFEPGRSGEVVVIDPIDGSTNASRGLPWYATAVCLVDGGGPAAAVVANQASGDRFWATRGGGAFRNGAPIRTSGCTAAAEAIAMLNGVPSRPLGVRQTRCYGAAALDLCMVACGTADGYVDCDDRTPGGAHGVWDYLAAMLVLQEAGGHVADARGRELIVLDTAERRTPVGAASVELLEALLAARG